MTADRFGILDFGLRASPPPVADVALGALYACCAVAVAISLAMAATGYGAEGEKKHPVYVGSRVCGSCHDSKEMGHQYSKWLASKHAGACVSLARPEAKQIAKWSGIPQEPRQAPMCLGCHATAHDAEDWEKDESFALEEGIQCEKCHGPGSEYMDRAVMVDRQAAVRAGLLMPDKADCLACHREKGSHLKVLKRSAVDIDTAWQAIAHPTPAQWKGRQPFSPPKPVAARPSSSQLIGSAADSALPARLPEEPESLRYKTPLNLALRPDGRELYVACEASSTVIVVDVAARRKAGEIGVGRQPNDVAFSPDNARAYVSNRLDDSVSVIDVPLRRQIATIPVGDEPHGVLTDRSGKTLYVLNASCDSVSVIDTATLKETKRLAASRSPWSLALWPDDSRICATNALSRFVGFREPSLSEVTILDTDRAMVDHRAVVPGANFMQGIDVHPSGEYALATLYRTKNLVPMTRLLQGWTITNGLAILWRDGRVDQVLLDEPHQCFPDPTDVAITPDGRLALVTSAGSDCVGVVDLAKLISLVRAASDEERRHVLPNHLGKPTEFVRKHIPTKNNPRGIVITRDGKTAFTANALDDSLTEIDVEKLEAVGRVDLGGPKEITKVRYGERLFNHARITFHRQFTCHSCHPDGHVDGLTYDTEPEGLRSSPVDNRTLRGILDTAPFKWEGTNPSLSRQCGARLAVLFTRIQPFTAEELEAVDNYICTIPRPPNRYRPLGARLTDAQRRGKRIFERTTTNDGRTIPKQNRCVTCHFPPLYTDRNRHDVGTQMPLDRQGRFDTPHLNNIYDSAPYLHNGAAHTLEEIWTRYNPNDTHGVTNDLTKDQLNDLIEYLKTL